MREGDSGLSLSPAFGGGGGGGATSFARGLRKANPSEPRVGERKEVGRYKKGRKYSSSIREDGWNGRRTDKEEKLGSFGLPPSPPRGDQFYMRGDFALGTNEKKGGWAPPPTMQLSLSLFSHCHHYHQLCRASVRCTDTHTHALLTVLVFFARWWRLAMPPPLRIVPCCLLRVLCCAVAGSLE